ncbi:MAG: 4-hydroxy-tetrahydrodipicolinate synthase [Actinobacteria bacterium]|nr:4-hydroxy-tetrahydrodipicolinate synthase [Actinomycetota bacterium]
MTKLEWSLRGVIVPLITPFKADLSVDYDGLSELVEYYVGDVGCDGICVCGTTGESPTLTHDEHKEVIRFVTEQVSDRIPVIAGAGSNSTAEAVELTRDAKEAGVDATLQVCPYYNKPTQEGIFQHFCRIAEAVDIPQIIYNIPGRTSRNIEPATLVRLWREVPQVVGLKDAAGDLRQSMDVLGRTAAEGFAVYSGEDILTFDLLCHGAMGGIAAVGHVVCREVQAMCAAVWDGDLVGARNIHYAIMPVVDALFIEPNPIPVKQAVEWMGLPAGPLRPPLGPLSEDGKKVLRATMEAGGWL